MNLSIFFGFWNVFSISLILPISRGLASNSK
jgi:hypothetical protein